MTIFLLGVLAGILITLAAAVLAFAIVERRTARKMEKDWRK